MCNLALDGGYQEAFLEEVVPVVCPMRFVRVKQEASQMFQADSMSKSQESRSQGAAWLTCRTPTSWCGWNLKYKAESSKRRGCEGGREPDHELLGRAWLMEVTPTLGAWASAHSSGRIGCILT